MRKKVFLTLSVIFMLGMGVTAQPTPTNPASNDTPESSQKEFTIGFNVRNSLYLEPLYYQLRFIGKYNQTTGDRLASAKTNVETLTKYNVTVR